MTAPLLAVTGATGRVGGRVAHRLAGLGIPHRLVVRDPSRVPATGAVDVVATDYADADAARAALRGVDVLFMVSAAEAADRVDQHRTFLDAAVAAGVRHVAYTSFLGAATDATFLLGRDHWATEEHLRASGMDWTLLRDNLYADFLPLMVGDDDVIRGPAGHGRVSAVAIDDVADVATAVLSDLAADGSAHRGQTYALTGPEALTLTDVATTVTAVTGRPVRYHDETLEEAYRSRAGYGAPDWQVDAWVSTYTAIAAGEMEHVSADVERVTGHPATALATLLGR